MWTNSVTCKGLSVFKWWLKSVQCVFYKAIYLHLWFLPNIHLHNSNYFLYNSFFQNPCGTIKLPFSDFKMPLLVVYPTYYPIFFHQLKVTWHFTVLKHSGWAVIFWHDSNLCFLYASLDKCTFLAPAFYCRYCYRRGIPGCRFPLQGIWVIFFSGITF